VVFKTDLVQILKMPFDKILVGAQHFEPTNILSILVYPSIANATILSKLIAAPAFQAWLKTAGSICC
jgi:hypothetical protein